MSRNPPTSSNPSTATDPRRTRPSQTRDTVYTPALRGGLLMTQPPRRGPPFSVSFRFDARGTGFARTVCTACQTGGGSRASGSEPESIPSRWRPTRHERPPSGKQPGRPEEPREAQLRPPRGTVRTGPDQTPDPEYPPPEAFRLHPGGPASTRLSRRTDRRRRTRVAPDHSVSRKTIPRPAAPRNPRPGHTTLRLQIFRK